MKICSFAMLSGDLKNLGFIGFCSKVA
jgi:hypothetical protein